MDLSNLLSSVFLYVVAGFVVLVAVSSVKPTSPLMVGLYVWSWPFVLLFYALRALVKYSEE